LQDLNNARLTKEAKANDLARPIKEARALDIKIDFENTIVVETPREGSSRINLTSRIDLTALRRKDKIKARKADKAKLRDWLPRASAESPYELRSKLKLIVTKLIVKRTKFSNTIVKMAKAILVAKVKLEFEQELE